MTALSVFTFPLPPHSLGVLVHAWASGDPDGAAKSCSRVSSRDTGLQGMCSTDQSFGEHVLQNCYREPLHSATCCSLHHEHPEVAHCVLCEGILQYQGRVKTRALCFDGGVRSFVVENSWWICISHLPSTRLRIFRCYLFPVRTQLRSSTHRS